MSSGKISTRFLIVSDTHDLSLEESTGPFQFPTPRADVLLHCGDLTQLGGISELKRAVRMLVNIDAELKLVIARNHDLSLDAEYSKSHPGVVDQKEHKDAMDVMNGTLAKENGVTYLEEGMHTFTLKSGASFKIYVSPYQPEFCDWAFPYKPEEDRYNLQYQVVTNQKYEIKSIATNPVPDFGSDGVDIMMTHGPPHRILDQCRNGNVGCPSLLQAVSRARPMLHCFGHIHEGHGAKIMSWKEEKNLRGEQAIEAHGHHQMNANPEPSKWPLVPGKETLMVNAAIMDGRYEPNNEPWLVDLDLPRS